MFSFRKFISSLISFRNYGKMIVNKYVGDEGQSLKMYA